MLRDRPKKEKLKWIELKLNNVRLYEDKEMLWYRLNESASISTTSGCLLYPNMIGGVIVTEGSFRSKTVIIPRIELTPSDLTFPFTFQRLQLPVRAAFVMTINKSQCQTLHKIGLFTENGADIFSHGQAYVALSRASYGPPGIVVFSKKKYKYCLQRSF